jgi:hypothetical protein
MSLQDAHALYSTWKAQRDIIDDPSLTVFGKAKAMSAIQNAASFREEPKPLLSMGDIVKGGIGAGMGYGISTLAAKWLGVSAATKSTMQNLGMGLGTILNIGNQWSHMKKGSAMDEDERRAAFRMGFLKGAADAGYFKGAAVNAVLPLSTETLAGPINFITDANATLADTGGALLGAMTGPEEADKDVTRMDMERQDLERQRRVLEAKRNNSILSRVLQARRAPAAPSFRGLTMPR